MSGGRQAGRQATYPPRMLEDKRSREKKSEVNKKRIVGSGSRTTIINTHTHTRAVIFGVSISRSRSFSDWSRGRPIAITAE